MRLKRMITLVIIIFLWAIAPSGEARKATLTQDEMAPFKGNECVWCHSKISSPLKITSRYAEWHISTHKINAISCEKCHGGNPKEQDKAKSHTGMLPASDPGSTLNPKNLPETCKACHQPYVASFIESKHFQALKASGIGPSCNTCHAHMASEVIYTPEQTGDMCASCHESNTSSLPKKPEIAAAAEETMQSIRRASMVVAWADRLLEEADKRQMESTAEHQEMKVVKALMTEAKAGFHAFNTEAVRKKADAAFEQGTKLKDGLRKKLYPNQ